MKDVAVLLNSRTRKKAYKKTEVWWQKEQLKRMGNVVFHMVVTVVLGTIKPVNPNCKIPVHCRHNIKGLSPEEVLGIVKIQNPQI